MLTKKQIASKISGVKSRNATLRQDIQTILNNIAGHAFQHGDVTQYDDLLSAVVGQDRHAIVRWMGEYGFATLDTETAKAKVQKKARKTADFEHGEAVTKWLGENATPWWEMVASKAQVANDLDAAASVKALAKRIAKAPENGRGVLVKDTQLDEAMAELQKVLDAARARQHNAAKEAEEQEGVTPSDAGMFC